MGLLVAARQAADDNTIRSRKDAIFMSANEDKETNTHSEYVILFSYDNNGYAKAYECYVARTFPVLSLQP
jgi:hypothetical protein